MKILIIGSGAREHTIAWKLNQSPRVTELFCCPGNAGIAQITKCIPGNVEDPNELAHLAELIGADLTVAGPEAPLVAGVSEVFNTRGLCLVGPSRTAAQLEGSKIFAKEFMERHSIPTARFVNCDSPHAALEALEKKFKFPVVTKADGLAAGKGVLIVHDRSEFDEAIRKTMIAKAFGEAGNRIVLEECLFGLEASLMLFTDGRDYKVIVPARDYKRVNDNDEGLNTGGMGSFSTPGLIGDEMLGRIAHEIIEPTLAGMAQEGSPFRGVLYIGLMFTEEGPKVIEYNVRLGDPETQVVLTRLDSDLVDIFEAIIEERMGSLDIEWSNDSTVCVVAASGGYPGKFEKGKIIKGLDEAASIEGVVVFHAGTKLDERGNYVTSGGRVLGATGRGKTLAAARSLAYEALGKITFDEIHYRTDISIRNVS